MEAVSPSVRIACDTPDRKSSGLSQVIVLPAASSQSRPDVHVTTDIHSRFAPNLLSDSDNRDFLRRVYPKTVRLTSRQVYYCPTTCTLSHAHVLPYTGPGRLAVVCSAESSSRTPCAESPEASQPAIDGFLPTVATKPSHASCIAWLARYSRGVELPRYSGCVPNTSGSSAARQAPIHPFELMFVKFQAYR